MLSFIFDILSLLDVTPPLSETMVTNFLTAILTLLTALGVIIDPTTRGVTDSDRAMTYD